MTVSPKTTPVKPAKPLRHRCLHGCGARFATWAEMVSHHKAKDAGGLPTCPALRKAAEQTAARNPGRRQTRTDRRDRDTARDVIDGYRCEKCRKILETEPALWSHKRSHIDEAGKGRRRTKHEN